MVCEKCEKKIASGVACPDKWKDGASNTIQSGKVKVNENKLLTKKNRYTPYAGGKCTVCKTGLHKPDHKYCHQCAYQKGLCEMCGKQILDVKKYKQSKA
ncbi:PDZ-binding protein [Dunaliella salina]|uniref:Cysteine-rich PDZ-binding protein n=1 Tax=Dunaliella salina TaxID=3046 RepID=A0ABQ7H0S6_DUNSA|nr:PDZ-binding protein [Dunaliella salina]|eukprot:KAF5840462.1 PDZ-binding protein [Dunaliella salina]